jgi:glycine cleavage system H protein
VNITVELPQLPALRQIYAWERCEKEGIGLEQLRFPEELLYSPTHEWVRVEGNRAIIGITDYAQSELGDVTYLELPKVGDTVEAGQPFCIIESVKADEELFAPVSGTVAAVNQNAVDHPEIVNEDPYGEGWLIVVEMSDPDELKSLMTAEQYRQMLEREGAI